MTEQSINPRLEVDIESRDRGIWFTGPVTPQHPINKEQAIRRWPRLVAHMVAESLGYFTVLSAANALAFHKAGKSFACEWYSHMCSCRGKGFFDEATLLDVGQKVVLSAIRNRHLHRGYMASYKQAMAQVQAELSKPGVTSGMLAAWF
jgi:hypothetical protein